MRSRINHLIISLLTPILNLVGIVKLYYNFIFTQKNRKVLFLKLDKFNHGRYGFQLINYFHSAGFHVVFYKSNHFLRNLNGYDRLILSLKNVSVYNHFIKYNEQDIFFLFNNKGIDLKFIPNKIFKLNLDYFSSFQEIVPNKIIMPFCIHPIMNRYIPKINPPKKNRILFYGSNDKFYDSKEVNEYFGLISRSEVFRIINKTGFNLISPNNYTELIDKLDSSEIRNAFFFIDSSKVWIPANKWMEILGTFDFFLATPGVKMPHAHNVIEAMNMKVIPIIEYFDWFSPKLLHFENCISFKNKEELITRIDQVLKMNDDIISEIRKNVYDYYLNNLEPSSFLKKVNLIQEKNIELFFNAEELSLKKQDF